jgi:Zn-dependent metalloprotease
VKSLIIVSPKILSLLMRLNPVSLFCCLLLICFFLSISSKAQQGNGILSSSKSKDGRLRFIKFQSAQAGKVKVDTSVGNIKKILNLGSNHSLVAQLLSRGSVDEKVGSNSSHKKFLQYFKGVKVEFGVLNIVAKGASLDALTGEYFPMDDNFSTSPSLSEQVALQRAIEFIGAQEYSWEDPSNVVPQVRQKPRGELVICKDFSQQSQADGALQMQLAFKFAIYAVHPLKYDYVYVDAVTGKILLDNPIIKHTDGIAATRYSGSRTIATTAGPSGNFVLKDSSDQYRVATYNLGQGTSYSTAPLFSDNDNNWSAAEFDDSSYDNAALDAHWGAMMTLDYWRTVHGRNSFDNNGAMIRSYVHYATNFGNAFWDGVEMTYGDGDGFSRFPFTSIDICGHEIGHGVCQYTANLIYSGESGALNESFSDIWGACIKRFAAPEKNTWLMGDEISVTGTPFRSLMNPKAYGQPDTYRGNLWYDNADVHVNSGVPNFWFYILTEGKSGTNDLGYTYNVTGIGITEAAKIAYRAESVYLFPSATFYDARIASLQSAEDLYGVNSNEVIQTREAWNAVGVYDVVSNPTNLTAILTNGNQVKLTWSYSPLQTVSGFVIEKAVEQGDFVQVAIVDSTVKQYIDSNVVNDSINGYRIRAFRNGNYSGYSNPALVSVGNAAYVMSPGYKIGCNFTFLDPGGYGLYGNSTNMFTTLVPAVPGNKMRIKFLKFRTQNGTDILYVYNGPNTASPLIGQFSGTNLPPQLESSATNGELSFLFYTNDQVQDSGWKATVTCAPYTDTDTTFTCTSSSDASVQFTSNIYGSLYQWQKFNGSTFTDIFDNAFYSGTSTWVLNAKMDGLINGDKFRCIVNGSMSRTFVIIKGNRWTGAVNTDWFNAQNWSCGVAPSSNSDVLVEAGKSNYPIITSDISVRSITVCTGARIEVAPGVKVNIAR